jgi:hypothetical protein
VARMDAEARRIWRLAVVLCLALAIPVVAVNLWVVPAQGPTPAAVHWGLAGLIILTFSLVFLLSAWSRTRVDGPLPTSAESLDRTPVR